jgi:hypothetical protein
MTWAEGDIRWSVAHAYTPNEQASYGGGFHLMLQDDLVSGRLRRRAGDALCKPASKFWGLHEDSVYCPLPSCTRCLDLAPKHGIDIEKSPRVRAYREQERQRLEAERGRLLALINAFATGPEALCERVQAIALAERSGVVERCTFGGAVELRRMLDPVLFRRGRYRPCGRAAVAMERRASSVKGFPRCHDHVDRSEGQRLEDILTALPPETIVRCWPYTDSPAEVLLDALHAGLIENETLWETRATGEWSYGTVDGEFFMEILG